MSIEKYYVWSTDEVQNIVSRLDDQVMENFEMTKEAEVMSVYDALDDVELLTPDTAAYVLLHHIDGTLLKDIYAYQKKEIQEKITHLQAMLTMDAQEDTMARVHYALHSDDIDLINITMANVNAVFLDGLEAGLNATQMAEIFNKRATNSFKTYMDICCLLVERADAVQQASPILIQNFLNYSEKLAKFLQPRQIDSLEAKVEQVQNAFKKTADMTQSKKETQEAERLSYQESKFEHLRELSKNKKKRSF